MPVRRSVLSPCTPAPVVKRPERGQRARGGRLQQHCRDELAGPRRPELLDVYASARDAATAARLWELTEQALGTPLPV